MQLFADIRHWIVQETRTLDEFDQGIQKLPFSKQRTLQVIFPVPQIYSVEESSVKVQNQRIHTEYQSDSPLGDLFTTTEKPVHPAIMEHFNMDEAHRAVEDFD